MKADSVLVDMWTELFMMNKPALLFEIDNIIQELQNYRNALTEGDAQTMHDLLRDGRELKEWSLQHANKE